MGKITLASALSFLPVVGPVVAALPEFKKLWDEIVSTFDGSDQQTLQQAYDLAISEAADAHQDLQDLVAQHTS